MASSSSVQADRENDPFDALDDAIVKAASNRVEGLPSICTVDGPDTDTAQVKYAIPISHVMKGEHFGHFSSPNRYFHRLHLCPIHAKALFTCPRCERSYGSEEMLEDHRRVMENCNKLESEEDILSPGQDAPSAPCKSTTCVLICPVVIILIRAKDLALSDWDFSRDPETLADLYRLEEGLIPPHDNNNERENNKVQTSFRKYLNPLPQVIFTTNSANSSWSMKPSPVTEGSAAKTPTQQSGTVTSTDRGSVQLDHEEVGLDGIDGTRKDTSGLQELDMLGLNLQ